MGEVKETIKVNRENDDSFVIVRTITEKADAKTLVKIIGDIEKGLETYRQQLEDMPRQNEEKEKFLKSQVDMIGSRLIEFSKHRKAAERKVAEELKKEAEKKEAEHGVLGKGDKGEEKTAEGKDVPVEHQQPGKA
jgi:Tat protein secretion system quality control protein TatD with DNase activity